MNIWSFVFGVLAALLFGIDFFLSRPTVADRRGHWGSLVSLGLFFFVLCFMFQLLVTTSDPIHF